MLNAKIAAPAPITAPGTCSGPNQRRLVEMRFIPRTSRFCFSCTRPVTAIAIMAGTKVSESTKADDKAMMTVSAIGSNILPSTPENVSSGT